MVPFSEAYLAAKLMSPSPSTWRMRAAQLFMASSALTTSMTYLPSSLRVNAPLSWR